MLSYPLDLAKPGARATLQSRQLVMVVVLFISRSFSALVEILMSLPVEAQTAHASRRIALSSGR